jgi:hypothetical protein
VLCPVSSALACSCLSCPRTSTCLPLAHLPLAHPPLAYLPCPCPVRPSPALPLPAYPSCPCPDSAAHLAGSPLAPLPTPLPCADHPITRARLDALSGICPVFVPPRFPRLRPALAASVSRSRCPLLARPFADRLRFDPSTPDAMLSRITTAPCPVFLPVDHPSSPLASVKPPASPALRVAGLDFHSGLALALRAGRKTCCFLSH